MGARKRRAGPALPPAHAAAPSTRAPRARPPPVARAPAVDVRARIQQVEALAHPANTWPVPEERVAPRYAQPRAGTRPAADTALASTAQAPLARTPATLRDSCHQASKRVSSSVVRRCVPRQSGRARLRAPGSRARRTTGGCRQARRVHIGTRCSPTTTRRRQRRMHRHLLCRPRHACPPRLHPSPPRRHPNLRR